MDSRVQESKEHLQWLIENKPTTERIFVAEEMPSISISVEESLRYLPQPSIRKRSIKQFLYTPATGSIQQVFSHSNNEIASDILTRSLSPSGKYEIMFRTTSDAKEYIQLWSKGHLLKSQSIATISKGIYRDAILGGIAWSPDEKFVCFVAEKKRDNYPYLWSCENFAQLSLSLKENEFKQDFGEMFPGKCEPTIFIYSVQANTVQDLKIPAELNIFGTYPIFDELSNIIFVGLFRHPFPKGIFAFVRHSSLFYVKNPLTASPTFTLMIENDFVCSSPHFSPDFKQLAYFAISEQIMTHTSAYELKIIQWPCKSLEKPVTSNVVIPEVKSPTLQEFPGIFGFQSEFHSSRSGFLSDSIHYVFNSYSHGILKVFIVNTHTKNLTEVKELTHDLNTIMAIKGNIAIVRSYSLNSLPYYNLIKFTLDGDKIPTVNHIVFGQQITCSPLSDKIVPFLNNITKKTFEFKKAEGYLYFNPTKGAAKQPVLIFVHGGPHSNYAEPYFNHVAMYLLQGYAAIIINYRGSLGFGKEMLEAAITKISEVEVEDVYNLVEKAIGENKELLDEKNIFYAGYSYGGFIGLWTAIRHPKWLRAAVIKNPVTNIIDMFEMADCPDWTYAEVLRAKMKMIPSLEDIKAFYERSPLYSAASIVDPILIMLGSKDLRVPNCGALVLFNALQEQKTPSKLLVFPEDNHSLNYADADEVGTLNSFIWYESHKI